MHALLDNAAAAQAFAVALIMKWRWRPDHQRGGDRGFAGSGCAIRPR